HRYLPISTPLNQWRLHVAKVIGRVQVRDAHAFALTRLFERDACFLNNRSSQHYRQCCEKVRMTGKRFEKCRRGLLGDFTIVARRGSLTRASGSLAREAETSVAGAFASSTAGDGVELEARLRLA